MKSTIQRRTGHVSVDNPPPSRPDLVGQVDVGSEVAWKTGTSFAFRDAWAIGISGPYVIVSAQGNDDNGTDADAQ